MNLVDALFQLAKGDSLGAAALLSAAARRLQLAGEAAEAQTGPDETTS